MAPYINTSILPQALVIEPISLCDLPALMVPSDQGYFIWVPDFERQQKEESLNRIESSVNKVSHE